MTREQIEKNDSAWEQIGERAGGFGGSPISRTQVPGGWLLVSVYQETGMVFVPDPQHQWDGTFRKPARREL